MSGVQSTHACDDCGSRDPSDSLHRTRTYEAHMSIISITFPPRAKSIPQVMFSNQIRIEYFFAIFVIARAEAYKNVSPENEINNHFKCNKTLRSA